MQVKHGNDKIIVFSKKFYVTVQTNIHLSFNQVFILMGLLSV